MRSPVRIIAIGCLLVTQLFLSDSAAAQSSRKKNLGLDLPTFGNSASADDVDIQVSAALIETGGKVTLNVTVQIPAGYHFYSMNPAQLAPTSIRLTDLSGLSEATDSWTTDKQPKSGIDENGDPFEKFTGKVTWSKELTGKLTPGLAITGTISGQYCTSSEDGLNGQCIPVRNREFRAVLANAGTGTEAGAQVPATSTPDDSTPATSESQPDRNPVTVSPKIGFGKSAKEGLIEFQIGLTPEHPRVGQEVSLSIRAKIKEPWHTFALDQDPEMAGLPTTIELDSTDGLESIDSDFRPSVDPEITTIDEFTQRIHHGEITWSQKFRLTEHTAGVNGTVRFQMCSNGTCLPPTKAAFELTLTAGTDDSPPAKGTTEDIPDEQSPQPKKTDGLANEGLIAFLLTAIGAGFVALLTPCVFPMIPVTVAFFLKQEEKQAGSSLKLAIVYCLSMIAAFTILGLLAAVISGPASLTLLANNRFLNLGFAGLFTFFGLMLLGVFEIQIPSWLLTWTSKREAAGGLVGVVFMALTFTLVSFTCTFAFVGSLLVVAARGDYLWPIIGMLGFSTAFASPFFVLAMFPSMLKKLPRSGGWMNDVKFVIGLVEIAAAVKFLSVADIGFSVGRIPVFVTYTIFMGTWILLSLTAGLFLLGLFRSPRPKFSIPRYVSAVLFLGFAGRLMAIVADVPLPADPVANLVAAFAPPDVQVYESEKLGYVISHHRMEYALEFDKAVAEATREQRPLFVDFTGVNCVNCRQMERTVLINHDITSILQKLVRAQLYTDEVPGIRNEALRNQLRDANIDLQSDLVADVTLPNYAVVSADGKTVLSVFKGLDSSGGTEFLRFLEVGLMRWDEHRKTQIADRSDSEAR